MASIRSVLIKTCMTSIHKEISQLEHWLSNLPNDEELSQPSVAASAASSSSCSSSSCSSSYTDVQRLLEGIERVSHQLSLQQITLGHITNRIENLENFRDIQIQQKEESSPWITDAVADLNDDDEEPVIHVIHMDESNHELPVVLHEPENEVVVPEIHPCDKTLTDAQVKEIIEQNEAEEKASHEVVPAVVEVFHKEEVAKMAPVNVEEVVEVEEEEEEVVQEEEVVEEETVVKAEQPVQPEEKPESAVNVEEEEEEVVEEEEEDSGTVFEVNGVTYYRDEDNQVFSVDDEGNLSDMPIGFWKDKTQTIRFYKMK